MPGVRLRDVRQKFSSFLSSLGGARAAGARPAAAAPSAEAEHRRRGRAARSSAPSPDQAAALAGAPRPSGLRAPRPQSGSPVPRSPAAERRASTLGDEFAGAPHAGNRGARTSRTQRRRGRSCGDSCFGAALGALLTILVAAPAGAVPPNEVLLARHLQRLGVIPGLCDAGAWPRAAVARRSQRPGTNSQVAARAAHAARQQGASAAISGARASTTPARRRPTPPRPSCCWSSSATSRGRPGAVPTGHDPGPAARQHPGAGGRRQRHLLAGRLLRHALPADAVRQLLPDLRRRRRRTAAAATRQCATTTSSSRTAPSRCPATSRDWVKLDLPESWYGADSDPWNFTDDLTGPVWRVARDAVAKFAAENPDFPWADYDNENPYGITGDDFNQADGYVDHLILIHAGSDQSAGGGAQDSDAIWAHSWGIYENSSGGPGDGPGMMVPGTEGQGPQGLGIWVYPYTINPEDGDLGVFCHEFGHDLGLPDEYDYSSTTGDATTGFWTIMASGSWLGRQWGLGSEPARDERVGQVRPRLRHAQGRQARHDRHREAPARGHRRRRRDRRHDPAAEAQARHRAQRQGRRHGVVLRHGQRPGQRLTTKAAVAVRRPTPSSRFRTWYDIEQGYDYGFVRVSDDGGATAWDTGNRRGTAGRTDTGRDWADTITYDLSAYAGKNVLLHFRYSPTAAWPARAGRSPTSPSAASSFAASAFTERRLAARGRREDADDATTTTSPSTAPTTAPTRASRTATS